MSTRKRKRLFAGLTTVAVISGCMGFGSKECILPDLRVSAAASKNLQMGDVNFDGYIDADDSSKILQHYLSLMLDTPGGRLDSVQTALADVDHNQAIDADDATMVLQQYVYLLTQTPSTWEIYSETYPAGRDPNASATTTPPEKDTTASFGSLKLKLGADTATADAQLGVPAEVLTEKHSNCTLEYRVYNAGKSNLSIVMADAGKIVGAFVMTDQWSYPTTVEPFITKESSTYTWMEYVYANEITVTECHDFRGGSGLYAVVLMKSGYSVNFSDKSDMNDFSTASKLCWHITNGLRAKHGLKALYWSETAAKCALKHSQDMAKNQFFDHVGSDGSQIGDRISAAGLEWCFVGENIEWGFSSVFLAVNGWYNSEDGHRETILHSLAYRMGAGFAYSGSTKFGVYGTQDFVTLFEDV